MRRTGFTLVELLVVMVVVAVLAAILLPVYADARLRGKNASCISNARQVAVALLRYADDWSGWIPKASGNAWANTVPISICPRAGYEYAAMPYARSRHIFFCPAQRYVLAQGSVLPALPPPPGAAWVRFNPLGDPRQAGFVSYGYSSDRGATTVLTSVRAPSRTIWLGETVDGSHEVSPWNLDTFRHSGRSSFVFYDGHVRFLTRDRTLAPRNLWAGY